MKKKLSNTKKQNIINNVQQNNQDAEYLPNDPDLSVVLNSSKYNDKDNEDM